MQMPPDDNQQHPDHHPDMESAGGGSRPSKKSARFDLPAAADDEYDGEVLVKHTSHAKALEKKYSSSLARNASSRIKQRLPSFTRRPQRFDRTKSAAVQALEGLKFISKSADSGATWVAVEDRFDGLASDTNGLLPRSLFGQCIGMNKESKEFAGELFDALARRRNVAGDSITKAQLRDFWDQISDQSFDCRLRTFFDMVDKNADGRISEDEIREIITLSASANKLSNIQKHADEYARLIMEELDPSNTGYIMIENLETLLLQGPSQPVRGGESRYLSKMLSEKLKPMQDHRLKILCSDFWYSVVDNWRRIWVVMLWVGVMAVLFAYKYVEYRDKAVFGVMGHCVCMAKGAAETLKLNMAVILLPVCRNTITWLRNNTKLGAVVPFDDNLNFHKVLAFAIAIGVGIHGISHLACDFPRLLDASPEKYEPMKPYFGDDQPTNYWHFVKGWEGVTGIAMVVLMAVSFTLATTWFRRNKVKLPKPFNKLTGFNAFWYTHHLFIIVYGLLIVHGIKLYLTHEWYKKTTWMYLAVPITLYAVERLVRAFRSTVEAVEIIKVAVYPGNVLALHMSKPQGFKYKSGQYIFVNCAAVSPFEWHPFSITSAPGDDYVSVHIRTLGDWTRQLKAIFSKASQQSPIGKSGLPNTDCSQVENNPNFPRVLIDGPYGAPTQDYKDYEVVLLVGLGIGTTPMISVVKDIVNNMRAIENDENMLEEGSGGPARERPALSPRQKMGSGSSRHDFKTRKAYFYWVTREQDSFDWFKNVMNEVVENDHKRVIELHNYCTSVYEEGDARCALIAMIQSINHAKNGVDIVSGTRVMSHFAKPNWRNVYKGIAVNHPNSTVGVFYCGAPPPVKELRQLACDFSHKTSTRFEFHKENF